MARCPACEYRYLSDYLLFKGRIYKRCGRCSLVFLDKETLGPDDSASYTGEYIHSRGDDDLESPVVKAKLSTANHYLSLMEGYVPKGRMLDIGCSTGAVLKAAKERGWDIHGIDINEEAVSVARRFIKTDNIHSGPIAKDTFSDNYFRVISAFDVLEHIPNPLEFMSLIGEKIEAGGLLFIITPNIYSVSALLLRERWPHMFLDHLCLYSPKSIRLLLEAGGFEVLKIGWAVKFVSFDMLGNHLKAHPQILFSGVLKSIFGYLSIHRDIIFPFNVGEMYVLARRR